MSTGLLEEYTNIFPAVRGMQAGKPCYIAMCPMRLVPKIFLFDEEDVPPELRAQRKLNEARIPDIVNYLVDNPENYTLSAITASINSQVHFKPMADTGPAINIGLLSIPMSAQILINDGQHRRKAIEEAIKEAHELGYDNIPVLFFIDEGLSRSQQMFADLNKHAVRPSDSLSTLYDRRDQGAALARYVYEHVPCFKKLTDLEHSSLSKRSSKLFTLSSIKLASRSLLRKTAKDDITGQEMKLAASYWLEVSHQMPDWQAALNKKVATADLRENQIHANGIGLHALGCAGADLISQRTKTWKKYIKAVKSIDWSRSNTQIWQGRATDMRGKISKAKLNVTLTANVIRLAYGVKLSTEDRIIEDQFKL